MNLQKKTAGMHVSTVLMATKNCELYRATFGWIRVKPVIPTPRILVELVFDNDARIPSHFNSIYFLIRCVYYFFNGYLGFYECQDLERKSQEKQL
jgi:hypothetical protein